jgi:hypothetical protein
MVQGMKRQNGISKMKSINMEEQYFKGVLAGYLGANYMCSPSEKTGKYLLEEIIAGGNFGKFGEQYESAHSGSSFNLYLKNLKRLGKVYSLCPSEVLWAPIWKPSHWLWRKWKGYL